MHMQRNKGEIRKFEKNIQHFIGNLNSFFFFLYELLYKLISNTKFLIGNFQYDRTKNDGSIEYVDCCKEWLFCYWPWL